MDWLEISVTTDAEAAEAVVELFNRFGRGQAVIEIPVDCFEYELSVSPPSSPVVVKTYLPVDDMAAGARRQLEEGLWHLRQIYPFPDPTIRQLAEANWAEAWKQQYHRQYIGQHIVIVPAWEGYVPATGEVAIRLEPGMAFGTGLHPTTRLCLAAMEMHVAPGCTVLDVGTGSGVLAIAAAKLGARSVLALDADPVAVGVAQENAGMNDVADRITVRHGSLRSTLRSTASWAVCLRTGQAEAVAGGDRVPRHFALDGSLDLLDHGQFDLIVVNILAPVIVGMAPALEARLGPNAWLVAAGLIESQEEEVCDALCKQGLRVVGRAQEKDWVLVLARRG